MATENAIPTIDLSPLRCGGDAEKRNVSRQIDIACTQMKAGHSQLDAKVEDAFSGRR